MSPGGIWCVISITVVSGEMALIMPFISPANQFFSPKSVIRAITGINVYKFLSGMFPIP